MLDRSCLALQTPSNTRACRVMSAALLAFGIFLGSAMMNPALPEPAAGEEEDYGEFTARPEELVSVATNDIVKSLRLNKTAMKLGRAVYDKSCASCHGADLKGLPDQHTPDLTDAEWRFSGDDLVSGGTTKYPSRSEEHTSELQSRENLVCRLLLEK